MEVLLRSDPGQGIPRASEQTRQARDRLMSDTSRERGERLHLSRLVLRERGRALQTPDAHTPRGPLDRSSRTFSPRLDSAFLFGTETSGRGKEKTKRSLPRSSVTFQACRPFPCPKKGQGGHIPVERGSRGLHGSDLDPTLSAWLRSVDASSRPLSPLGSRLGSAEGLRGRGGGRAPGRGRRGGEEP